MFARRFFPDQYFTRRYWPCRFGGVLNGAWQDAIEVSSSGAITVQGNGVRIGLTKSGAFVFESDSETVELVRRDSVEAT